MNATTRALKREQAACRLLARAARTDLYPRDFLPLQGRKGSWVSPKRLRASAYALLAKAAAARGVAF